MTNANRNDQLSDQKLAKIEKSIEQRLTAAFEARFQMQESKFMSMLERVIESNEAIKSQMGQQIFTL